MIHPTALRILSVMLVASGCIASFPATADSARETRLETVINTIPDIIFYKDLDGVYRGGNQAWAALAGKPLEQLIGKTDFDLFPEDLARSFRAYDQKMLESGETSRNDEWVDYPDGRHVLLDTLKTPWLDAEGKVLGVLGICRDITHRAGNDPAQEAALLEANNHFYKALDAMFTGDLSLMRAVWSHSDEASLQGPFGNRIDGSEAVLAHFDKESKMGMAGRVLCKNIRTGLGTDMAYVTCIEEGDNMTLNGQPVVVHHRATNVFRLEDGAWKMVHHHTDLAPSLEE